MGLFLSIVSFFYLKRFS
ncbi:MAG: hypothetical protein AB7T03_04240 [Bacilli bacterium]